MYHPSNVLFTRKCRSRATSNISKNKEEEEERKESRKKCKCLKFVWGWKMMERADAGDWTDKWDTDIRAPRG